ncbi:hypothetical protein [Phytobacter diazotrophicus]|uniref:hypothetical protein n=1 Tax=Phytobacter diazotrophicus TaxID=395631 RepID=UPI002FF925D3
MSAELGTEIVDNPPEKIAFMFPARYNLKGAVDPVLNFKANENNALSLSVGISFIQLDVNANYWVLFGLEDPNGKAVVNSTHGMSAIPSDQIDPEKKTSYLSANFYFNITLPGVYKFYCELRNPLVNFGNALDYKEIYFNVAQAEQENGQ